MSKYTRECKGIEIDVYDVLKAFDVRCPATQHALKKLLATGSRGHKDETTDLKEAKESIERAIELLGDDATKCMDNIFNGASLGIPEENLEAYKDYIRLLSLPVLAGDQVRLFDECKKELIEAGVLK